MARPLNVLMVVAGVADPRKPFPASVDRASLETHRCAHGALSPFDEAALELGLKLRDADAGVQLQAAVFSASPAEPLQRQVAAFRLDAVTGVLVNPFRAADSLSLARCLADMVRSVKPVPALVLCGRELGDCDDGSVPPLLAAALGTAFVGQAIAVRVDGDRVHVVRQAGARQEEVTHALPAVVAVTNESGNRLRHPLLKNVMVARKQPVPTVPLPDTAAEAPAGTTLTAVSAAIARRAVQACQMLQGTPQQQAAALADRLVEAKGSLG